MGGAGAPAASRPLGSFSATYIYIYLLPSPQRRLGSRATAVPCTIAVLDSSLRWNDERRKGQ
jgi:hypothetical protein